MFVAAGYALVSTVGCFVTSGRITGMSLAAKTPEAVVALGPAYRSVSEES